MSVVASGALELVGNTPLVQLASSGLNPEVRIWGKAEFTNPGGSIKDRPALAMVEAAERNGSLASGGLLIEATSGNTGISLAMIAAMRGYRCTLVMPEDMSVERRRVIAAYGAEVHLTPVKEGMAGAVARAQQLARRHPGSFMPGQFDNPANPDCHEAGTGREILEQTKGRVDVLVAGVGTGGTLTGVARVLKRELGSHIKVVAVEPEHCAVLSGGAPGIHAIQGLGAGFIPRVLDRTLVDEVRTVSDASAEAMARRLAQKEGLLVGISSGANVHVAQELARELACGDIVTILCDGGERYLA